MSKHNFSYHYNVQEDMWAKLVLEELKDSVKIWMKVEISKESNYLPILLQREYWFIQFRITDSYDSKSSIYFHEASIKAHVVSANEIIFTHTVPKFDQATQFLFVKYFTNEYEDEYIVDSPIKIYETTFYKPFILAKSPSNVPVFDHYFSPADTLILLSSMYQDFKINYIKFTYNPSYPPHLMPESNENEIALETDSLIEASRGEKIILNTKGIYKIGYSSGTKYRNMLCMINKYPRVTKLREIADPIIYIATDDERRAIRSSPSPKKMIDNFWIDLAKDKELARKMIRNYYRKIEQANKMFTQYKEGWKTDKGMIYIIFGLPDKVKKTDLKETWEYNGRPNIPALRFDFAAKLNALGDYYWQLNRTKEYAQVWNNTVGLWRKGILEK